MDVSRFFTKELIDTLTEYLPDSDGNWWLRVKALNAKERKEREQMAIVEKRYMPKDKDGLEEYKNNKFEETALAFQVAKVRQYEYDKCIEDFCLPYVTKENKVIDFSMSKNSYPDVRKFLDNVPQPLVEFIEDVISKVNREGKYTVEVTEAKNVSEVSSEEVLEKMTKEKSK